MATIADISQVLGDYMLKGWVLTDQSCPTPGCTVPLLRSPKGRTPITTICAKCDNRNTESAHLQSGNPVSSSKSNASTDSQISRSSTPPTEFSEMPESPVFVPIEESEESRRRRAQSDQASSEIGKRLLKGWAMLGEECPNDSCYGVPLVRPPKSGGEKDPRKECIICGHVYVSEVDWAGRETLVAQETKSDATINDNIPAGRASIPQTHSSVTKTSDPEHHPFSSPFGRRLEVEESHLRGTPSVKPKVLLESPPRFPRDDDVVSAPRKPVIEKVGIYGEASRTLQQSLRVLSTRLTSLNSQSIIEPTTIGSTADAMTKVGQALIQMQELERSQT